MTKNIPVLYSRDYENVNILVWLEVLNMYILLNQRQFIFIKSIWRYFHDILLDFPDAALCNILFRLGRKMK